MFVHVCIYRASSSFFHLGAYSFLLCTLNHYPPPAEHRTHTRLAKKLLVDLTVLCCDIKDGAVRKNFFRKLFGEPPPLSWI